VPRRRPSSCRLLLGGLLWLGAGRAGEAAAPRPAIDVPPGALARWAGDRLERCAVGERHFAPLDDACWYPVDLVASGSFEVSRRRAGVWERRTLRIVEYPYPTERIEIADPDKVNPPARDLARIAAEQKRVARLWSLDTPRRFSLPLGAPLAELPAGGRFGARRIFNGEPRSPHSGTDFPAAEGTAVYAAAAGRVALAEDQFFAGRAVFIDHGDGLITMYFHLSEIAVRPGREVRAGEQVGRVGATGRVSGPHLHFAVRWRGARIDPALLLQPAGVVSFR
jgi:murein DD-endopeptidase MepM/ murein hydrolase activator NlpD